MAATDEKLSPTEGKTLRDFGQATLDSLWGDNLDALEAQTDLVNLLMLSDKPEIAEWAWGFGKDLTSTRVRKAGGREALEEAYKAASVRFDDLHARMNPKSPEEAVLNQPPSWDEYEAARQEYAAARSAWRQADGEGFYYKKGRLFGEEYLPRTKVVTNRGFFDSDHRDEYFIPPEIGNLSLDEVFEDIGGYLMSERGQMLTGEIERDENGRRFVMTSSGPKDLERWFERMDRDAARRSGLGLMGGPGPEAPPGSIAEWAVKRGLDLAALSMLEGFDPKGIIYDVKTPHPGVTIPWLPVDLYGKEDVYATYKALSEDPLAYRAYSELLREMQENGELRATFGEQAQLAGVGMMEFIAVNGAIQSAVRGAMAASKASGLTKLLQRHQGAKLVGRTAATAAAASSLTQAPGKVRFLGAMFDKRNLFEEVAYAVTRNAVTGVGDFASGVKEGLTEGVLEGIAFLGWRGVASSVRAPEAISRWWTGGIDKTPHPLRAFSREWNQPADIVARKLKALPSKDVDLVRLMQRATQRQLGVENLSRVLDAAVVGGLFGAYQGARAEHGDGWESMGIGEKLGAVFSNVGSPEALGNMVTYATTAGAWAGASHWQNRAKAMPPERLAAMEMAARGLIQGSLAPGKVDNYLDALKVFEEIEHANPGLTEGLAPRAEMFEKPVELTSEDAQTIVDSTTGHAAYAGLDPVERVRKFVGEELVPGLRDVTAEASESSAEVFQKASRLRQEAKGPLPVVVRPDSSVSDLIEATDDTPDSYALRALDVGQGALNILEAAGKIDLSKQGLDQTETLETLHDIALNPDSIRKEFMEDFGSWGGEEQAAAAAEDLVDYATRYIAYHQQSAIALAREFPVNWSSRGEDLPTAAETTVDIIRTYWQARSQERAQGEVEPGTKRRLAGFGMLDERGVIADWVPEALQSWHQAAIDGKTDVQDTMARFYGGLVPQLYGRIGTGRFGEGNLVRSVLEDLDGYKLHVPGTSPGRLIAPFRALTRPLLGYQRQLGRMASGWSNSELVSRQMRRTKGIVSRNISKDSIYALQFKQAMDSLHTEFGPSGAPFSVQKLWIEFMDSGEYKSMHTPAQAVEKYGPIGRPMFIAATKMQDAIGRMGVDGAQLGIFLQEQIAKYNRAYVPHEYLRREARDMYRAWKGGDYYGILTGRSLSRGSGGDTTTQDRQMQIRHPELFDKYRGQIGKSIVYLGVLRDLASGGVAVDPDVVRGLSEYNQAQYQVAAFVPDDWGTNVDPINGRAVRVEAEQLGEVLLDIRRRMMSEAEWKRARKIWGRKSDPKAYIGKPDLELRDASFLKKVDGKKPWSPELQKTLDTYLGVRKFDKTGRPVPGEWEREPALIPVGAGRELAVLFRRTFPQVDPNSRVQRAWQGLDQALANWRRSMTIFRQKHWVLARVSDVFNNWTNGKVHITDFISSTLFGKGRYYESWTAANDLYDLSNLGMPDAKPEGWDDGRWARAKEAERVGELWFGATMMQSIIDSGAFSYYSGMTDKRHYERDLTDDIKSQGYGEDLEADLVNALGRQTSVMRDSAMARDRRRLERWDVDDPAHRTKALMDLVSEYQTHEFVAKYAAYLAIKRRNPSMTIEAAAHLAAQGTADYADTSPTLRLWSTDFNIFDGQKGAGQMGAVARILLARPFMLYQQSMIPNHLSSVVRRPLSSMAATALWSSIAAGVWRGMSDEEKEDEARSRAASRDQPGRPVLTKREAAERSTKLPKMQLPNPFGGDVWGRAKREVAWHSLLKLASLSPTEMSAPPRGLETRFTDMEDMSGAGGTLFKGLRLGRDLPALSSADQAREFFEGLEGILPSLAFAALSGAWDTGRPAAAAAMAKMGGDGERAHVKGAAAFDEALKFAATFFRKTQGDIGSSPAQFLGQTGQSGLRALLDGDQRLADYFRGIVPSYRPPFAQALGGAFWDTYLSTRSNIPYRDIQDDTALVDNLVPVLLEGPARPGSFEGTRKKKAVKEVTDQFLATATGLYTQFRQFGPVPREVAAELFRLGHTDNLNARLAVAMDLTQDFVPGTETLKARRELRTAIGKRIGKETDPETQRLMIRAHQNLVRGAAFEGPIQAMILDAAETARLTPPEFSAILRASLKDSRGRGLVEYMHRDLIRSKNPELGGEYYRIFMSLPPADEDATYRKHYMELWDYFNPFERGFPGPPAGSTMPQNVLRSERAGGGLIFQNLGQR